MAKFYVGQRVRIKWSNGWPELAGQEGAVAEIGDFERVSESNGPYRVAPDCWGSCVAPRASLYGGRKFVPSEEQLEPIQPEGWKKISWEEMKDLWTPKELSHA